MNQSLPVTPSLPAGGTPDDAVDCIEIDSPCDVPWDSLVGDDRVRHCGKCRQNVYNLEAMDRQQALKLIAIREQRVCLRVFRRPDGTVVTADCWSRLRVARRRGLWAFAGMLLVVAWAQLAAMAVGVRALRRVSDHHIMGGRIEGKIAPSLPRAPLHFSERTMGLMLPQPRAVLGRMRTIPPRKPK